MGLVGSIKGSMLGIEKSKQMCVCVCVCVREREREREREDVKMISQKMKNCFVSQFLFKVKSPRKKHAFEIS